MSLFLLIILCLTYRLFYLGLIELNAYRYCLMMSHILRIIWLKQYFKNGLYGTQTCCKIYHFNILATANRRIRFCDPFFLHTQHLISCYREQLSECWRYYSVYLCRHAAFGLVKTPIGVLWTEIENQCFALGPDWSAPKKTLGPLDVSVFNCVDNEINIFVKRSGNESQNNLNSGGERNRKGFELFDQHEGSIYLRLSYPF